MTTAKRITVALTLLLGMVPVLALTSLGQVMIDRPLDEQGIWKGGELKQAFSPLGNVVVQPLGVEQIEGGGVGLSFYVGWGEVAPTTYSQVNKVVEQFRGLMEWSTRPEFNDRGAFISALPLEQARRSFRGEHTVKQVSLSDLGHEMERFCKFTQESLKDTEPGLDHGEELGLSAEPFEDSEYRVFLVAQPEQFSGSPTSSSDRMLHFGITKDEWLLLSREADQSLGSLSTAQVSFLFRLKQRYEMVRLTPDDVVALSNGLAGWESGVPTPRLRQAIQKVRRILLEASVKNLGVVLEPKD
jgi:hypothetical protein